jgi:predicted restriction endonuclease
MWPATAEQVTQALGILKADHSTNVKQPLQRKGNPLWHMDYHGIAKEYYSTHPKLPPGSPKEHVAHVKTAVLYYLNKRLEDLGQGPSAESELEQALAAAEQDVHQESAAEPLPADDYDARQRVLRQIVRRRGQPKFRSALMNAYSGRCAVTGYEAEDALEAAHLRSYKGPESNTLSNGLLLRVDIHTLLDLKLLAINPQPREIAVSKLLSATQYGSLSGQPITEPAMPSQRPSQDALDALWQEFTEEEAHRSAAN